MDFLPPNGQRPVEMTPEELEAYGYRLVRTQRSRPKPLHFGNEQCPSPSAIIHRGRLRTRPTLRTYRPFELVRSYCAETINRRPLRVRRFCLGCP